MKKIIVLILSLVLVFSLGVCASATAPESFDPTLNITQSGDTITVTMNDLPDGVSAELTIPCAGWDDATVKNSAGQEVTSSFDQTEDTVTFAAVGGVYTITEKTNSNTGGGTGSGGNTGGNTGTGTGTGAGSTGTGGTGVGGSTATGGTTGATTTTTVESNKTFDAGITLYVGMSVAAAIGSAVVISKKRKN